MLACIGLILVLVAGLLRPPALVRRQDIFDVGGLPPPALATTVMLAGFRCIAADLLWLRAAGLQDKGRYLELAQLAEWITALEPRFAPAWTVHAWNMAYNISLMMENDKDRWRWVRNGISLLRDRGIPLNADNPLLYTELAFIFLDKLGNPGNPESQTLKRAWAKEMMQVVGKSGYPDYDSLASDSNAVARLKEYRLLPDVMQEIDRVYGPLDWRTPQAHALYWAYLGNTVGGTNIHDAVCDRTIYQALSATFDHGKLTYSSTGDVFVTSCNFDVLPKTLAAYEDAIANSKNDLPIVAYTNFLKSAIITLKFYRHGEESRRLFDKLRREYPSSDKRTFEEFTKNPGCTLPQILTPSGDTQ
jgi:hypothetical protein